MNWLSGWFHSRRQVARPSEDRGLRLWCKCAHPVTPFMAEDSSPSRETPYPDDPDALICGLRFHTLKGRWGHKNKVFGEWRVLLMPSGRLEPYSTDDFEKARLDLLDYCPGGSRYWTVARFCDGECERLQTQLNLKGELG